MLVVDNLCCTKGELCKSGVVPTGGCVNGGFPVELTRGESVTDMTTTSSPQCLCQKKKNICASHVRSGNPECNGLTVFHHVLPNKFRYRQWILSVSQLGSQKCIDACWNCIGKTPAKSGRLTTAPRLLQLFCRFWAVKATVAFSNFLCILPDTEFKKKYHKTVQMFCRRLKANNQQTRYHDMNTCSYTISLHLMFKFIYCSSTEYHCFFDRVASFKNSL